MEPLVGVRQSAARKWSFVFVKSSLYSPLHRSAVNDLGLKINATAISPWPSNYRQALLRKSPLSLQRMHRPPLFPFKAENSPETTKIPGWGNGSCPLQAPANQYFWGGKDGGRFQTSGLLLLLLWWLCQRHTCVTPEFSTDSYDQCSLKHLQKLCLKS